MELEQHSDEQHVLSPSPLLNHHASVPNFVTRGNRVSGQVRFDLGYEDDSNPHAAGAARRLASRSMSALTVPSQGNNGG